MVSKSVSQSVSQVGGAFAPPLKDLCRFLQENPEYGVPPEWADVVKQSVSRKPFPGVEVVTSLAFLMPLRVVSRVTSRRACLTES